MKDVKNVSIILPSLDPNEKLLTVVDGLLEVGFADIILVNDGSKPENLHYFETAALHPQVHLLHHEVNRGKGAALKTALRWFLRHRPDAAGVVTVDGDNQHHPQDTLACAQRMLETGSVVLGCRDFDSPDVPKRSRFGNRAARNAFKFFCGMTISDTQTGLRAIPTHAVEVLLKVRGNRFEYETNVLLAMKRHNIPLDEVPIRTVYIEDNEDSHFRPVRDSVRIYSLILRHFLQYTVSSLICSSLDTALFTTLSFLLRDMLTGLALTAVPTVAARAVSSLLNFFLNKKLVFHSKGETEKNLLRYYCLVIPQLLAQMLLTYTICLVFSISGDQTLLRAVVHSCVMVALFFVSYFIQQRWVFGQRNKKKG